MTDARQKFPADTGLSDQDLLDFGSGHVAYIRPITIMDRPMYAIHAADGTPISIAETQDVAIEAIRQHDLDPIRLH